MMKQWEETIAIVPDEGPHRMMWRDKGNWLVVPLDEALKREILRQLHNH
jgi:hypothetical protein